MEVGVAYTILEGPIDNADQLRAALPGAQLVTGKGSRLVRLAMPMNKLVQRMRGNRRVASGVTDEKISAPPNDDHRTVTTS